MIVIEFYNLIVILLFVKKHYKRYFSNYFLIILFIIFLIYTNKKKENISSLHEKNYTSKNQFYRRTILNFQIHIILMT